MNYRETFTFENTWLYKCEIYWSWFPFISVSSADGLFTSGVSLLNKLKDFEKGTSIFHAEYWHRVSGDRASLKDVVRHQYGYTFAHYYPELITIAADTPS